MNILQEMEREAQLKNASHHVIHLEYALREMKLIKEKLECGENLNQIERKFLEGYSIK